MVANGVPGQLVRAGHITYKYDSKTNPLFGQKDLLVLLLQSASKNNIIQEDHFDEHLTLEDRFTYNYTYKTNGLPQRAEVINGLPDENPTTSQVEYVYQ